MQDWRILGIAVIWLGYVQAGSADPVVPKTPVVEEAEEPAALAPVEEGPDSIADPVVEGQLVQQFLNRTSVIVGEGFAPLREGEAAQPVRTARVEAPWHLASSPPAWHAPLQPTEVHLLREAAWALEQSAHQLETGELYDRADQLRDLARQLRQDARQLRAP